MRSIRNCSLHRSLKRRFGLLPLTLDSKHQDLRTPSKEANQVCHLTRGCKAFGRNLSIASTQANPWNAYTNAIPARRAQRQRKKVRRKQARRRHRRTAHREALVLRISWMVPGLSEASIDVTSIWCVTPIEPGEGRRRNPLWARLPSKPSCP